MAKKKDDPSGIDWSREEKILSERNNPSTERKESFFSKVHPKTILISVGVLALIVLVVFGLKSLSNTINTTGNAVAESEDTNEVTSGDYICSDGTLVATKEDCDAKPAEPEVASETTETTEKTEETVIEVEEPIVTTYDNTEISLTGIGCEWKTTYAKITSVEYTISNGENGRIQPAKLSLYNEDRIKSPKEYLLSGELSELKSGSTKPFTLDIPEGEGFSAPGEEKEYTISIVDSTNKKIGSTARLQFTPSETVCTD